MEHWFSLSISMEQLAALYIRSLDDYVASHQSEDDNSKKTKGVPFKVRSTLLINSNFLWQRPQRETHPARMGFALWALS